MINLEALKSVQFVVGSDGRPSAVQLGIETWASLLGWLADTDDRALIKQARPKLRSQPAQAGECARPGVRKMSPGRQNAGPNVRPIRPGNTCRNVIAANVRRNGRPNSSNVRPSGRHAGANSSSAKPKTPRGAPLAATFARRGPPSRWPRRCFGLPMFTVGTHVTAELIVAAMRALCPPELQFVISDNGAQFIAEAFANFARDVEFVPVRPAPHRPCTNGIAERMVRTVKAWLETHSWNNPEDLETLLAELVIYYNDRPHQGAELEGLSPNEFARRLADCSTC